MQDVMPPSLEAHRKLLEALAYRMLGSIAEAEDVVQDTFIRALTSPPDLERPLRPWLVRVACNLAKDQLRKRAVRSYRGPWLPEPTSTPPTDPSADPELQLRLAQTATLAWLAAAETLTPEQRAVVLLRDVMDWSVSEVGAALERSSGAVRALHTRARRALDDVLIPSLDSDSLRAHQRALEELLNALSTGDEGALEKLLANDVVLSSDGGGEVYAVGRLLVGARRVASVVIALVKASSAPQSVRIIDVNGMPTIIEHDAPHRLSRWPTTSLTSVVLDSSGQIARVFNVVAPSKLTHIERGRESHITTPMP